MGLAGLESPAHKRGIADGRFMISDGWNFNAPEKRPEAASTNAPLPQIGNRQSESGNASASQRADQLVHLLPQRFHVGVVHGRIERGDAVGVGAGAAEGVVQVAGAHFAGGALRAGRAVGASLAGGANEGELLPARINVGRVRATHLRGEVECALKEHDAPCAIDLRAPSALPYKAPDGAARRALRAGVAFLPLWNGVNQPLERIELGTDFIGIGLLTILRILRIECIHVFPLSSNACFFSATRFSVQVLFAYNSMPLRHSRYSIKNYLDAVVTQPALAVPPPSLHRRANGRSARQGPAQRPKNRAANRRRSEPSCDNVRHSPRCGWLWLPQRYVRPERARRGPLPTASLLNFAKNSVFIGVFVFFRGGRQL